MDPAVKELSTALGKNVEAAGRMLQSKRVLTKEDWTLLRDMLSDSAATAQTIRDTIYK